MPAAMDFALYLGLLLAEFLVRALPPAAGPALAEALGRLWYLVDARRRKRARESLRLAEAGGLVVLDREALVRETLRSLMWVPLEVMIFPRQFRTARDVLRRCRFYGDWAGFRADIQAGRGGLLVSGHLGSWELAAWALRFLDVPARVVARPLENPWLDRRAVGARGGEARVIAKHGAAREMLRTLRARGWVGVMADQNAGEGGVFVDFFGLPASTHAAPAALAVRTGVPVWAAGCLRRAAPVLTYEIHLRRLPAPAPDLPEAEAVRTLLRAFLAALEDWVRLAPAQYNWVHRRWKSRPAGEAPDARTPRYDRRTPPPGR